jgi:hypothetical protein
MTANIHERGIHKKINMLIFYLTETGIQYRELFVCFNSKAKFCEVSYMYVKFKIIFYLHNVQT